MELSPENSENCIFKLLPRYKVRSVGDEVSLSMKDRAQTKLGYDTHIEFEIDGSRVTGL